MELILIFLAAATVLFVLFYIVPKFDKDKEAQKALDNYLNIPLSNLEIGLRYERYIGYLYEIEGYNVEYHGANNGFEDMGRDLIIKSDNEVRIIQTKRWASHKQIKEKDIFQLYGTMTHYRLTTETGNRWVKPVFYTSARYSKKAKEVAQVLGVELKTEEFKKLYPMVKCKVSENGEKTYHLPFDLDYDKIRIESNNGDFFAYTVKEAVTQGFIRSKDLNKAA